jgi:hypothetical protein
MVCEKKPNIIKTPKGTANFGMFREFCPIQGDEDVIVSVQAKAG